MIRGKCPMCGKAYEVATLDDLPSFPFCTPRCRLVDLGRWIDGAYVMPEAKSSTPDAAEVPQAEEDDEE